jgi:tripeptidyl-peptidase-1
MIFSWKCGWPISRLNRKFLARSQKHLGYANRLYRSHPDSPKYGQYWTEEEIHDMFAPATETVQAVRNWLTMFGIHESRIVHSDNKGWLAFDATVEEAEKLLVTEYYEHEHRHRSNIRVGCDEYDISISVLDFS